MSIVHVLGVKALLNNMALATEKVAKGARIGVTKAALFLVERDAKKNAPVDLGNLKASGYTIGPSGLASIQTSFVGDNASQLQVSQDQSVARSKEKVEVSVVPTAIVGFGANYAIYVHELHATKGKFLERALRENRENILRVISDEIQKALG